MAKDAPDVTARIHSGDARELVGRLLSASRDLPLFGLLDPYGFGLPAQLPVAQLMNRPRDRCWPPSG